LQRLCKGSVTVCEESVIFAINIVAIQAINTPAMGVFDAYFADF
jgi:hypothetical protein